MPDSPVGETDAGERRWRLCAGAYDRARTPPRRVAVDGRRRPWEGPADRDGEEDLSVAHGSQSGRGAVEPVRPDCRDGSDWLVRPGQPIPLFMGVGAVRIMDREARHRRGWTGCA